ncbi:hypothetical protein [Bacillus sp. MSP13]|uniref:hypothetical protein n=1 Tax=Bacillus sp. MSP13 TaxID=1071061 RepID=UPI00057BF2F9|nr:hypothetical protein [Bacillus sp. MSP13]
MQESSFKGKINESLLIIQIVFPLTGIFLTIMTIWLANANQVNDIELYVIAGFSYGVFFFVFPLGIYIFRKRVLIKKVKDIGGYQ